MSQMKLQSWIKIDKLKWNYLSANPNAISLLEERYENVDWYYLHFNPNGIELLKENYE